MLIVITINLHLNYQYQITETYNPSSQLHISYEGSCNNDWL